MPDTPSFSPREASVVRTTGETDISASLNLDGEGSAEIATGIGFFDHMLVLLAEHGRFDIELQCEGDLEVDTHHSIEDVGITLGQAFARAIGDKHFIARYGHAYVPMDETLARTVVDLSGRFFLHFDASFERSRIGTLPTEMVEHFWYSFAEHLRCNLHVTVLHGTNSHHKVEAIFKSAARALDYAAGRDPSHSEVPSTKGRLA